MSTRMISYILQIVGITLLCVTAFIAHPIGGVAATGLLLTALGVSIERDANKAGK